MFSKILKYFKKIYNILLFIIEEFIPSIALLIIVFSLVIQVFMRAVFRISLTSTYELSLWSYVWALYLGAAYARRENKHIKLDIFYEKFPEKAKRIIDIALNLIVIAVFGILFWPVWDYLWFLRRIETHTLNLSWTLVFFPFIVFFALIIIHNIEFVIRDIKYLFRN